MRKILLLIVLLMVLSGCGSERYEFTGASENWKVFYVAEVSNEERQETTGMIEYIGDEPIPETFDYEIGNLLTALGGTGKVLTDRKAVIGIDRCTGCGTFQKDDELEVEISWNGQSDTFILTNKETH